MRGERHEGAMMSEVIHEMRLELYHFAFSRLNEVNASELNIVIQIRARDIII